MSGRPTTLGELLRASEGPQEPKGACRAENSLPDGLGRAQHVAGTISAVEIPGDLQQYKAEILAGLAAAQLRMSELSKAWGFPSARAKSSIIENLSARTDSNAGMRNSLPVMNLALTRDFVSADKTIKLWPLLAVSAWQHNKSGAYRAWQLAKLLDVQGRGAILEADLQELARKQGIPCRTWRRWLADAKRLTLICPYYLPGWVRLASYQNAALLFDCDNIGTRPVRMALRRFLSHGWRAHVWGGFEETHSQRPISRLKQAELAGVPVSTQRRYDDAAGVVRRSNISISDRSPDELDGLNEFEKSEVWYKFYDPRRHKVVCARHLPDTRTSSTAEIMQKGRSKKINKALRNNGLLILKQAQSCSAGDLPAIRLFYDTPQQARQLMRQLSRTDQTPPHEVYLRAPGGKQATFWRPLPFGLPGQTTCA